MLRTSICMDETEGTMHTLNRKTLTTKPLALRMSLCARNLPCLFGNLLCCYQLYSFVNTRKSCGFVKTKGFIFFFWECREPKGVLLISWTWNSFSLQEKKTVKDTGMEMNEWKKNDFVPMNMKAFHFYAGLRTVFLMAQFTKNML